MNEILSGAWDAARGLLILGIGYFVCHITRTMLQEYKGSASRAYLTIIGICLVIGLILGKYRPATDEDGYPVEPDPAEKIEPYRKRATMVFMFLLIPSIITAARALGKRQGD